MLSTIELDYCRKCDYLFPERTQICPACGEKTIPGKYEKRLIIERLAFIFSSSFIGFVVSLIFGASYGTASVVVIIVAVTNYSTYHTAKFLFGMNEGLKELIQVEDGHKYKKTDFSPSRFALEFLRFPWLLIKLMFRIVFFWI